MSAQEGLATIRARSEVWRERMINDLTIDQALEMAHAARDDIPLLLAEIDDWTEIREALMAWDEANHLASLHALHGKDFEQFVPLHERASEAFARLQRALDKRRMARKVRP